MAKKDTSPVEMARSDFGSYYKSQPNALNLAYNAIPEDDVWNSSPIVCQEELAGDVEKSTDGVVFEIDLDEVKPLVPPDGGWGWFVVLGSFMCMFLVDGVCFSYGIFLSELESTFGATKMQMTLAGSLLTGCYFMVGPIVSGLMNRFGTRKLVICGSIISSVAIFASSFATDVNTFIGVFGILGGVGYGLIYLPAATVVTSWFVKKRATVTGIITAGSGIGITCYSLAIPHLIDAYTWRRCIWVLAALNLNAAVAGALFRPLWSNQPPETEPTFPEQASGPHVTRQASSKLSTVSLSRRKSDLKSGDFEVEHLQVPGDQVNLRTPNTVESAPRVAPKRETFRRSNTPGEDVAITYGNQLLPVPEAAIISPNERLPMLSVEAVNRIAEEVLNRAAITSTTSLAGPDRSGKRKSSVFIGGSQRWFASTASQLGQVSTKPSTTAAVFLKPDGMGSMSYFASAVSLKAGGESTLDPLDEALVRDTIVKELRKEVARPVHRKDLFLSGSLIQLNEYIASANVDAYIRNITTPAEEVQARSPFSAMLRSIFNASILKSPTFQLLNVSSILSMIGYIVPYQFLKDNAQTYGFEEAESAYLLAYLGIMNTISRVFSGFLSDRPWADVIKLNNFSLIIAGSVTALVPLFQTYAGLLFYACFFGFTIAPFIAVRTVLIVKVLGLDRLTNAYGFFLLFQGMAIVVAPPLFGYVYDKLRSFQYIFIIGGLTLLLSGLLCIPLSCLSRWEQRKEVQDTEQECGPLDEANVSSHFGLLRILRRVRDRYKRWNRRRSNEEAIRIGPAKL